MDPLQKLIQPTSQQVDHNTAVVEHGVPQEEVAEEALVDFMDRDLLLVQVMACRNGNLAPRGLVMAQVPLS